MVSMKSSLFLLAAFNSLAGVSAQSDSQFYPSTIGSQVFDEQYSLLKIAGGIGPYSSRRGSGIDPNPPAGCRIDQVVMLHRHGERYPEADDSAEYEASLAKVQSLGSQYFTGDYSFLNTWTYYADNSTYGQETTTGPYAGTRSSFAQGQTTRQRYSDLYAEGSNIKMWASSSERVQVTAQYFAQGFLGTDADCLADIVVIQEDPDLGANTFTPTCKGLGGTTCNAKTASLTIWQSTADRLNQQLPGANLTSDDAVNIMDVAMYEINVRGNSPWINIFTPDEWVAFEYDRTYRDYCKKGLASPNSVAEGSTLTNATVAVLEQGPSANQNITFMFAHDTQISAVIGALNVLNQTNTFSETEPVFGNQYEDSDIVPMGAHLAFERFACDDNNSYIRLVLNDAVLPFQDCTQGPGYSCSQDEFSKRVLELYNNEGWPNCKAAKKGAAPLTFLWE